MPIEHDGHQHPDPTPEQIEAAKLPIGFPLHHGVIKIHIGDGAIVGITTEIMVYDDTGKDEMGTALVFLMMKAAKLLQASRGDRALMMRVDPFPPDIAELLKAINPEQVRETIDEVMKDTRAELQRALGIEPDTATSQPTTPVPDVFRSAFEGDAELPNGG